MYAVPNTSSLYGKNRKIVIQSSFKTKVELVKEDN